MEINRESAIMVHKQGSIYDVELNYILNRILHKSTNGFKSTFAMFQVNEHYSYKNGQAIKEELIKREFIVNEHTDDDVYRLIIKW